MNMIEERDKNTILKIVRDTIKDHINYGKGEQDYWSKADEDLIRSMVKDELIDIIKDGV